LLAGGVTDTLDDGVVVVVVEAVAEASTLSILDTHSTSAAERVPLAISVLRADTHALAWGISDEGVEVDTLETFSADPEVGRSDETTARLTEASEGGAEGKDLSALFVLVESVGDAAPFLA